MYINIMAVTHDLYSGRKLIRDLRNYIEKLVSEDINVDLDAVYRVAHAEDYVLDADIVIGNGLCKDWNKDGVSVPVVYNSAGLARKNGKIYVNSHVARYLPSVLARAIKIAAKRKVLA